MYIPCLAYAVHACLNRTIPMSRLQEFEYEDDADEDEDGDTGMENKYYHAKS